MGSDRVDFDGVLLWISDGVNPIGWTLARFRFRMVRLLWILDSDWLVWVGLVVVTMVGG